MSGVGILPALEIQGTDKMPMPQNHQNHPAFMQRQLLKSSPIYATPK